MAIDDIMINGSSLESDVVLQVARGVCNNGAKIFPTVQLANETRAKIDHTRKLIEEQLLKPSAPAIYGFNTGCGALKEVRLSVADIVSFNQLYTLSHCVAVGEPLKKDVVRATIIVRSNQLATGYSGVSSELIEALLGLLNAGVTPVIPSSGSLGASGDLAPLSNIGAVLIGEPRARAIYQDTVLPAPKALAAAGLKPITLKAKEGMALNNGSTVSLGHAVLTEADASAALETAETGTALSLEAIRGETNAYAAPIHDARGFQAQQLSAARMRRLLDGSERTTEAVRRKWLGASEDAPINLPSRVQDAYSFRCAPQVHGAAHDALYYFHHAIAGDLNAATDNPLVFTLDNDERVNSLSGGNFLGIQLAHGADLMAIALTKVAQASERRTFRLLNPSMSFQLPEQLSGSTPGLNSGLMIAQYTQASLVNECAVLASPASIHPAVTSAGQEDLASMSLFAVRKLDDIVSRLQVVIAIELLCAAQGITRTQSRLGNPRLGVGTMAALRVIREHVAELDEDRYLQDDVSTVIDLVRSGHLLNEVRKALAQTAPPSQLIWHWRQ